MAFRKATCQRPVLPSSIQSTTPAVSMNLLLSYDMSDLSTPFAGSFGSKLRIAGEGGRNFIDFFSVCAHISVS